MPTQRNELALMLTAAESASGWLIKGGETADLCKRLVAMADRVNDWLDSVPTATIANAAADDLYEGVPLSIVGERVVRYRHYTLYIGSERLAHWVRKDTTGVGRD